MILPGVLGALLAMSFCLEPAHAAAPEPAAAPLTGGSIHKVSQVPGSALAATPATEVPERQFSPYLHPAAPVAYVPGDYLTADGRTLVALSFDDGPDTVNTPKVLAALRDAGVHATFFLIGLHVERDPAEARQVVSEGHEVGPHGYRHRAMSRMTDADLHADMASSVAALRVVAPQARIAWFRPPGGPATRAWWPRPPGFRWIPSGGTWIRGTGRRVVRRRRWWRR